VQSKKKQLTNEIYLIKEEFSKGKRILSIVDEVTKRCKRCCKE
jgi:hypothetical protein